MDYSWGDESVRQGSLRQNSLASRIEFLYRGSHVRYARRHLFCLQDKKSNIVELECLEKNQLKWQ